MQTETALEFDMQWFAHAYSDGLGLIPRIGTYVIMVMPIRPFFGLPEPATDD